MEEPGCHVHTSDERVRAKYTRVGDQEEGRRMFVHRDVQFEGQSVRPPLNVSHSIGSLPFSFSISPSCAPFKFLFSTPPPLARRYAIYE